MDLSQVTLTQIRYAVAVAETRSFRRAAERCFVSQPGLSMQLSKLEDCLGVRLFDRSKPPILQTPEGEIALAQMRRILAETERLGQTLADDGVLRGSYRLAVVPTLAGTVLPLFLPRFCADFPHVELKIEERKTQDIIERRSVDQLDGAILSTPLEVPGLTEQVFGSRTPLGLLVAQRLPAQEEASGSKGPRRKAALAAS